MAKSKKPEVVKLDDSVVEELKQLRTEQSNTQLDIGALSTQQHILQKQLCARMVRESSDSSYGSGWF